MKIQSFSHLINYSSQIREKEGGQPLDQDGKQRRQPQQEQKEDEEEIEATPELVDQAVEAFRAEMQSKPYPLNPSVEMEGVGLKVVLKDMAGSVIWKMPGEEFLRLRRAGPQGEVRGKILDRKL